MPRPFQPVAIVAATCILPGAQTLDELYRMFTENRTAIGRIPDERLDRSLYFSADRDVPNTTYSQTAALLSPWEFSRPPRLPPKQAAQLDPAHRLAIEAGQRIVDALQDRWLPRERTGVWIANTCGALTNQVRMAGYLSSARWAKRAMGLKPELADRIAAFQDAWARRNPHPREDGAINGNILCGRVANYFDLKGAQMSVDANCASSMAALRGACLSLEDGGVDMAVVGSIGTQSVEQLVIQARAHALAPGPSFPFDRDTSGFIPGEGAIMVALVRAEDAERRALPTLGVIRSIGSSLNGRGTSPWSPSEAAERLAVTRAWDEGEFSPDGADGRIDYIEAHGTATRVGDSTEFAAMLATYGKTAYGSPIPFGSVKSVVGHTIESAGLAGVLRALYVFASGRLPASVGVREPADYIASGGDRLRLVRESEPADGDPGRTRRVAVSSFGVGGVNYHAILESALEPGAATTRREPSREPIAVIGVSAIMPQAPDVDAVWEQLRAGTAVRVPLDRTIPDFELYHHPEVSRRDHTVSVASATVQTPVLREPARWRVVPKRADRLFTDHVLLLNAASQLVATGVIPDSPEIRQRSGVYVTDVMDADSRNLLLSSIVFARWWRDLREQLGAAADPQAFAELEQALRDDPRLGLRALNEDDSTAGQGVQNATRVASGLDLGGAAVAVNSACASGLAALSMAMQELRAGTLDFALLGGASLAVDEVNQVALSAIGSLSPSGEGRPYDERADGFIIGSGATWFALKRLSDAERDGDTVLAVVRECAGSSDGRGKSLLAPSREGRHDVIHRVVTRTGIDPHTVQYAEGHGAANVLGDASELEAIGSAMGTVQRPVRVGSIKGNYGHLKGPAALAGLLKVVLCLRAQTLVPTPGFRRRGTLPGVDDRLIRITDACETWPANVDGQPRRAAVNAFGLGGTNFQAIVDEYRPAAPHDGADAGPQRAALRVTAMTPEELARVLSGAEADTDDGHAADAWRATLFVRGTKAERAGGKALAAQVRRRAGAVPGEITDLGAWSGPEARTGPVAAMFPGQSGAQHFDAVAWLAMRTMHGPAALDTVEQVLGAPGRTVAAALREGSLDALGEMRTRSGTSQLLGLIASHLVWGRLRELTRRPVAALGHSAGEFAALVAAGCLSFEDAVDLVWRRGCLAEQAAAGREGLMAAVFAGPGRLAELGAGTDGAFIGTVNGPKFCVVSGWREPVCALLDRARAAKIESTPLDVSLPFHTPLLAEAAGELRRVLANVHVAAPKTPAYSAVLGGPYPAGTDGDTVRDAIAALYTDPVRLDLLLEHAAAAGVRRFVECGTGRSLSRSAAAVLTAGRPHLAVAGVTSAAEGFSRFDAALWVAGLTDDDMPSADEATAPRKATAPAAAPAVTAPGFKLLTPVSVPAPMYRGEAWTGVQVLVVCTRPGDLGSAFARELSAAGALVECTDIRELTASGQNGEPVPAARLAHRLSAPDGPRWLVWADPADPGEAAGPAALARLSCLRAVVRGLAEGWEREGEGGLVIVTEIDGRVGDSPARIDPAGGALAGFARALSREYPRAGVLLADVGRAVRPAAAAGLVAAAGRPPAGYRDRGLSGPSQYYASRLAAVALAAPEDGSGRNPAVPAAGMLGALHEPQAAVLVSGGVTGIVAHSLLAAARRLHEAGAAPLPGRLILLSRTAPSGEPVADPSEALARLRARKGARLVAWRRAHTGRSLHEFEDEWRRTLHAMEARATLDALRALGIRAEHEVLDVCDARGLRALGERLRLDGVTVRTIVHGAGIERSSRITEKSPAQWEATAAVKVLGFHNLVAAAGDGLRLAIAHGSLSGSLGLPGQTDYSAANEYLAFAIARLRAQRPAVTAQYIGWPAWDGIGLAADPAVKRKLEGGMGLQYLPPGLGAQWAGLIAEHAATLPSHLVLMPVPVPQIAAAHVADAAGPDGRWWLVDTVVREGGVTRVRRRYDTADPRDGELGDHRVRDNIRVAGVQVVEQLAEAYAAAGGVGAAGHLELRDIVFHQGLVTGTSGRRPTEVVIEPRADGAASLRLETVPMLRGDFPGPGTVTLATATAEPLADYEQPARVDVALAVAEAGAADPIELARRFGIGYTGRFATPVTALRHPGFAAAGRFTVAAAPTRGAATLSDPATLDVAIRMVAAAAADDPEAERGLPSAVARVVLPVGTTRSAPDEGAARLRYVFVDVEPGGGYHVTLTDRRGAVLVSIHGLRLQPPSDQAPRRPSPVPGEHEKESK